MGVLLWIMLRSTIVHSMIHGRLLLDLIMLKWVTREYQILQFIGVMVLLLRLKSQRISSLRITMFIEL